MKMKKNLVFRLGLLALVLTLVTMPLVSGTYAKYVTSKVGEATARVAKWGVEITDLDNDLDGFFAKKYNKDDSAYTGTLSVEAATVNGETDNVVAPGTGGTFNKISITGTPEVAVRVAAELDTSATEFTGWLVDLNGSNSAYYLPIVVTVKALNDTTVNVYGMDYKDEGSYADNVAAFITAIDTEVKKATKDYAPNTDLSNEADSTFLEISWAWAFENTSSAHLDEYNKDEDDTFLGDLDDAPTIKFALKVSVTQID